MTCVHPHQLSLSNNAGLWSFPEASPLDNCAVAGWGSKTKGRRHDSRRPPRVAGARRSAKGTLVTRTAAVACAPADGLMDDAERGNPPCGQLCPADAAREVTMPATLQQTAALAMSQNAALLVFS